MSYSHRQTRCSRLTLFLETLFCLMDQAVLLLANTGESRVRDDRRRQRRRQSDGHDEKEARPNAMFGLLLGSEPLGSFLGGVKLLQMLLLFIGAHTTSFPLWPSTSEVALGWRWAIGECSK